MNDYETSYNVIEVYLILWLVRILLSLVLKITMLRLFTVVLSLFLSCLRGNLNPLLLRLLVKLIFLSIFACRKNQLVFTPTDPWGCWRQLGWLRFQHRYRVRRWHFNWRLPRRLLFSFRRLDWWPFWRCYHWKIPTPDSFYLNYINN